ncbi:MAG: phosphoglycerate dehydrogenase [Planctomycetia bacterium]|nr:phosphoglycerate dehydrogenase [Planctomycetia bacterium]
MPRVFVADKLETPGLDFMRQAGLELDLRPGLKGEELQAAVRAAEGVIVRSGTTITAAELETPGKLRVIVRAGVGVDNIDVATATRRGILVMNTPGGNTVSTAEQTIALLFALARHTPAADASLRAGKWERSKFTGTQLAGKTIGVIGLGRIGREVARRCVGMDMKVIGFDPFIPATAAGFEVAADLSSLLSRCDFLTVHTPLSDETKGLIGAAQLSTMPKGARVLNCARGGIIDEAALAAALQSGHIAGAALDVFSEEPPPAGHPLIGLPNVVVTPHLGASTVEAQLSVAREAGQLMVDYLTRGVVGFAVNMPAVDRAELDEMRLYIDLARRLGLLLGQLAPAAPHKAELLYRGDVAKRSTRLITAAFAAGLLETRVEGVNIVNAPLLASERGIEMIEQKSTQKGDFSTMIEAELHTAKGKISAAGTLFGNQYLRLVRLGEYHLDAYLDGLMLLFHHQDVPGLIGFVGTLFGKMGVNIAQMTVGRQSPGGVAIGVLNLDSQPSEEGLREVKSHPKISSAEVVKLPPAGQMPPWFG